MEEGGWAELTVVPDGDYVDNDDFLDVAGILLLEPGNSAAVLVFEHLWAKNLVSALAGAGGDAAVQRAHSGIRSPRLTATALAFGPFVGNLALCPPRET